MPKCSFKFMKFPLISLGLIALSMISCQRHQDALTSEQAFSEKFASRIEHSDALVSTIAFGSCANQDVAQQPALALAAEKKPDLFVFLGDNIYGDTYEMDTLRAKYQRWASQPSFQQLASATSFVATWDDHDYGWNDSGRHYPYKEESKEIFLEFFEVTPEDIRRQREGIYTSYYFSEGEDTLQLLVLDTRTFRDHLRKYNGEPVDSTLFHYGLDYYPYAEDDTDSTLLGEAQWQWLEEQLEVPADVRLVASSTQFSISWNSYEAWVNFPHEQQRMLDLIKKTKANGIFFISGDVHYAELSELKVEGLYPLYDITSSGITSTWGFATPNDNRIAGPVMDNNFGLISIDWKAEDPLIRWQIYDINNELRVNKEVRLSELQM
jgi:alkaline phosphatase D